jgi:integrase
MPGLKVKWRKGIAYAVGTVAGNRIRESLGVRDPDQAEEQKAKLETRLWQRHNYGEEAVRTFEEAALSYMKQGGERRYIPKVLKHLKGRKLGSIKPAELRQMAIEIYPNASPATRNRQAIIPARAVINHGHDLGWCGPIKVKQFDVPRSRKNRPVDRAWLDTFLAESDASGLPHLSACVLFMHQNAARVSEAINVLGEHTDLQERVILLAKTKTDEWSPRYITAELAVRIMALAPEPGKRIFGYTDRQAVNRRMKAVCERAGIPYRSSHAAGRHSFGTNTMAAGARIKDAMDAGGWKSARLFMETYVHSQEGGRNIAGMFDRETGIFDAKAVQSIKQRRLRFGKRNGKR